MYVKRRIQRAKKIMDALTSEAKLRILRLIAERPLSATEIGEILGLSLPAITSHLKDLEEAGLIRMVEIRRGRGRPAKLYTLAKDRLTLDIDLKAFLEVPDEEELERLVDEYTKKKAEGGLKKLTIADIADTLGVGRTIASVIYERLSTDPTPLLEAIASKIEEELDGESTTMDLSKRLRTDRYWISKAVKLLESRGLVEVKGGRVRRLA